MSIIINSKQTNFMKKFFSMMATAMLVLSAIACTKEVQPKDLSEDSQTVSTMVNTKTFGSKTPIITVYVETNDVNPLNAGDYYMNGEAFVDVVILFAANIHVDSEGDPCLYLNDKLTPVLVDGAYETYVKPLQDKGIKVLLGVLGDWQHMGVASMDDEQAEKFAAILAYVVESYGLDGVDFDDEYANYDGTYTVTSDSFSNLIEETRTALGTSKMITVFGYGDYVSTIDSTAGAMLDYAWSNFAYYNTSMISGVTAARWAPCAYSFSNSYSTSRMKTYAGYAASNGYGAIMFFNLRPYSDVSPMSYFQAVATGAYSGTVTRSGGNRSRDAGSVTDGYTITYDMLP